MKVTTLTLSYLAGLANAGIISPLSPTGTADDSSVSATALPIDVPVVRLVSKIELSNATIRNANHVFNAIRGAMRQWDSSWNHNGMSFFLATVPEGTQLYHGRREAEPVRGMEWLAFEPEHAIGFAGLRTSPPHRRGKGAGERAPRSHGADKRFSDGNGADEAQNEFDEEHVHDGSEHCLYDVPPLLPPPQRDERLRGSPPSRGFSDYPPHDSDRPPLSRQHEVGSHRQPSPPGSRWSEKQLRRDREQHVLSVEENFNDHQLPPPDENQIGRLHHYRAAHDLNLLLLDGMSAGKTDKGTLDSQDYILRFNSTQDAPHYAFDDFNRAQALCNLTRDSWDNMVDGFIRMEAGFEIVLCSFEEHLTFERAQEVHYGDKGKGRWNGDSNGFRFYRAVADRFHGIGGERVNIDYSNMISAFTYQFHGDLFVIDPVTEDQMLPRLKDQSHSTLKQIHDDVRSIVMNPGPRGGVEWQSIADMLVQRYAMPLRYLTSGVSDKAVATELGNLLRVFNSDDSTDVELVTSRCVDQFLPPGWETVFAGRVIYQVGSHLCRTLVEAQRMFEPTESSAHHPRHNEAIKATIGVAGSTKYDAKSHIADLVAYLDWPIWRECSPSCAYDELCVLPIWPLTGNADDRLNPRCKNETTFGGERWRPGGKGYWYGDGEGPG